MLPTLYSFPHHTHTHTHTHIYIYIRILFSFLYLFLGMKCFIPISWYKSFRYYIYIYIYCDEKIWHPNTFAELWVRGCDSLIVSNHSSKQNNGKRGHLSLPPSLSLQGDMSVGEPHSLIAMYVSAEKQTFNHDCCRGRARQKNQHVVNFQTTEIS